jgi:hypothetical protein
MTIRSIPVISCVFAAPIVASPAVAQVGTQARAIVTIAPCETGRTGWVPPAGFGQILAERLGQARRQAVDQAGDSIMTAAAKLRGD